MMRRIFRPVAALVAVICAAGSAHATIRDKVFEASILGGIESADSDALSNNTVGLRLAFAVQPRLMIELMVSGINTTRELSGYAGPLSNPANQVPFSHQFEASNYRFYAVGITSNFRSDLDVRIVPYIGVGLGVATESRKGRLFCVDLHASDATTCADINPDGTVKDPNNNMLDPNGVQFEQFLPEDDTGTLITGEAGLRFFILPWLTGKVETRYYHHDTFGEDQDAFELSAGASFFFGGRK